MPQGVVAGGSGGGILGRSAVKCRITLRVPGAVDIMEPEEYGELFESAPGVDPIEVTIHSVHVDGSDLVYDVTLDPRAYFRQAVQVGEDQLEVLAGLQSVGLPQEALAELVEWARTADLNVAQVGPDGVDSYPTGFNI